MIKVIPVQEPASFDKLVRKPGLEFLANHPNSDSTDFNPLWRKIIPELRQAYKQVCSYTCHWIAPDTGGNSVDHFKPKRLYPKEAYEWYNYRFVCTRLNARKGTQEILDPFLVEDGWFVLDFPSLQVKPDSNLDDALKVKVEDTCEILGLNDEDTCIAARNAYLKEYCLGAKFSYLERNAPFIARELERQKLIEEVKIMMGYEEHE